MPGFFGHRTVLADLRKHLRTGKVTSATLLSRTPPDTFASVSYSYCYVPPIDEGTAYGTGYEAQAATLTLWQLGEATPPRSEDRLADAAGRTWEIVGVRTRLNADANFAVHDLTCHRRAT